jgi:hypothetical protein
MEMGELDRSARWPTTRKVAIIIALLIGLLWAINPEDPGHTQLYVSPWGSDRDGGTAAGRPLRHIQAALDRATPGSTIRLSPGLYRERLSTVRSGTVHEPIAILGPGTWTGQRDDERATVRDTGTVFSVNHSHYLIAGFAIEGQEGVDYDSLPVRLGDVDSAKDAIQRDVRLSKLIVIGQNNVGVGVTDVTVRRMSLRGAGQECVRVRNGAHGNVIEDSTIRWCGLYSSPDQYSYRYHNGEGVYLGTSAKSEGEQTGGQDPSAWNIVRYNDISTYGTECLDIKENAHDNSFYGNKCENNAEPVDQGGSNVEVRGYRNLLAGNLIRGSLGWNVKLASDGGAVDRGHNSVRHNFLGAARSANVYVNQTLPGPICGNLSSDDDGLVTLAGQAGLNPARRCESDGRYLAMPGYGVLSMSGPSNRTSKLGREF